MENSFLIGLVSIIFFGVGAQWLAWRTKLPGILLLLLSGILAGPVLGILYPQELLGEALSPFISLSVGVILFEGGLSLKFSELKDIGGTVISLVTAGVLITWIVSSLSAFYLFDLGIELAVLTGAILIVTGPTVIIPLLRQVRPTTRVSSLLKWESIIIDPIGALLAILVFEVIITSGFSEATSLAFFSIVKTIFFGTSIGLLGAGIVYVLLRRYMLPDYLENPVNLMIVLCVFTLSDAFQHESGLWATTVMGIALANQKLARIHHIVEFKENLRVLLLSTIFILLAARVNLENLTGALNWKMALFIGILIFVVRPLSVYLSSIGSQLPNREKLFVSWMAPRGVVAASIASLFALELSGLGFDQADRLVPIVFTVIISTVAIYGLSANKVATFLGVSKQSPDGCLIIGAHSWARKLATLIQGEGVKVLVADTNRSNIKKAGKEGLNTFYGNILAEYALEDIELEGIGKLISLTHNDEVNALTVIRFRQLFSSSGVYQLAPYSQEGREQEVPENMSGRTLFDNDLNFDVISNILNSGGYFEMFEAESQDYIKEFNEKMGEKYIPLFYFSDTKQAIPYTSDYSPTLKVNDKVLCLIKSDSPPAV